MSLRGRKVVLVDERGACQCQVELSRQMLREQDVAAAYRQQDLKVSRLVGSSRFIRSR
jgi:hypothetical protein